MPVASRPVTADYFTVQFRALLTAPSPDGSPWTHRKVARAAQTAGHQLSYSYVQSLTSGTQTNPTLAALTALSAVFQVPISYFYEETPEHEVDAALDILCRLPLATILQHAAQRLSPTQLESLARGLEQHNSTANITRSASQQMDQA